VKGFVEFPELTPEAVAAVNASFLATGHAAAGPTVATRRQLAAFLRAALLLCEDFGELEALASNLHSLPPPPPTLAEAREAARQLAGPCAAVVHAYLSTLREAEQ